MESKASWSPKGKCYGDLSFDVFDRKNKKFCTGCPVISLCRTYALVHDEKGVWGGTTEYQRKKVDPVIKETLRTVFKQAGLLEHRPGFSIDEVLEAKLPPVQIDPTAQQVA